MGDFFKEIGRAILTAGSFLINPALGVSVGMGMYGEELGLRGGEPQESEESRRLREMITGYVQQGLQAQGYTPDQMATLMERVAQEQMGAERNIGQRVSQYMAGRGLLDSGPAISERIRQEGGIVMEGARQRAGITQASIDEQSRRRAASLQGALGLLGLMSEQDRAKWLQEQQGQNILGQLISGGAAAYFGTPSNSGLEAILAGMGNASLGSPTGGLAPMTPTPSASGLTGGYTAPIVAQPQRNYGLGVGGVTVSGRSAPQSGGQGFMGAIGNRPRQTGYQRSSIYSQSYRPQQRFRQRVQGR